MKITQFRNYQEMSRQAAVMVVSELERNEKILLCAPTGSSPAGLYKEMEKFSRQGKADFKHLRIIKLDEWGGLSENHPSTCENFLRSRLLEPLGIPDSAYISFQSNPADPHEECIRIRKELELQGPIDLCILGLGTNGHLGLNEPGPSLEPYCHRAELSPESLQHEMIRSMDPKPGYGLTLGMMEIISSRKIILLVSGKNKKEVIEQLLNKKISAELPASLLWLHRDVECMIDETSRS